MGGIVTLASCSYPDQAEPYGVQTVDRLVIPEHFAFQVCLLEVNETLHIGSQLVAYIQQAPLKDLSISLPIILSLISSCPFWLHRFRGEICHALTARLIVSESLILSLYYNDSANSCAKRRKLINVPSNASKDSAPQIGEVESDHSDSAVTEPPPSQLFHYSYDYTPFRPEPVLKWWVNVAAETRSDSTFVADMPSETVLYDPIEPKHLVSRFKVYHIKEPYDVLARKKVELYFRAPSNPEVFNLSSVVILRSGPDPKRDLSIMSIFEYMNYIWFTRDNSFMNIIISVKTHKVIPLTENLGAFECINNAYRLNQVSEIETRPLNRLIATAAGFYVACFVLGIHDRCDSNLWILSDGTYFSQDFGPCLSGKTSLSIPLLLRKLLQDKWDDFISVCLTSFDMLRFDRKQLIEYSKLMFSQHDPQYVQKQISFRCTPEARSELFELLLSSPNDF